MDIFWWIQVEWKLINHIWCKMLIVECFNQSTSLRCICEYNGFINFLISRNGWWCIQCCTYCVEWVITCLKCGHPVVWQFVMKAKLPTSHHTTITITIIMISATITGIAITMFRKPWDIHICVKYAHSMLHQVKCGYSTIYQDSVFWC